MADEGHRDTERLIRDMEKRLTKEYLQASAEVQGKLTDYLARFEKKDEIWKKRLDNGEVTAEEYVKWRTGQIMMGKRWQDMRDVLAEDMHNANMIARSTVLGYMPDVYAINHNYGTFQVEKGSRVNTSYTLYDRDTVERIVREDPQLLPVPGVQMNQTFKEFDAFVQGEDIDLTPAKKRAFNKIIDKGKDIRWQKGKIQSVTLQSILQGESIPHMAERIAREMGEMNRESSIRYARTASTAAENAGRMDAYKRANDLGIKTKKTWVATLDGRTREEHRYLDGQTVDVDEDFEVDGEYISYPGDPRAPGHLVWNCRCTTIAQVAGFEKDITADLGLRNENHLGDMTYEEWKEAKATSHPIMKPVIMESAAKARAIRDLYKGG